MSKSLEGRVVSIVWEDAWSDDEARVELGEDSETRPFIIELVGFLIKDDKDGIFVAREAMQDQTYRSVQYIPRGMVRKVEVLK